MPLLPSAPRPTSRLRLAAAFATIFATTSAVAEIPVGAGRTTAALDAFDLDVFTYRPPACRPTGLLLVFHGMGRDAAAYRDAARPLADALCLVVVAPLFDAARFPASRYQRGGVVADGARLPPQAWTIAAVPALAAWARRQAGDDRLPVRLFGHSAGAQFLSRAAAYLPLDATRIVVAAPSTFVEPDLDVAAPYGFGGLFATPAAAEAALGRYLSAPLTVVVGSEDTGRAHLAVDAAARAQGENRLDRARRVFARARAAASARGWTFGWRWLEVPGVGHDAKKSLASPQVRAALAP